jgi:hypothetical protein
MMGLVGEHGLPLVVVQQLQRRPRDIDARLQQPDAEGMRLVIVEHVCAAHARHVAEYRQSPLEAPSGA